MKNQWLEWFIGFTEGAFAGSLLTSIVGKEKRLRFVITQKEKEILEHIKDTLGFGRVYHFPKGNYYRYVVEDYKHIYILATLFNGNFVINHRIKQLERWIISLNNHIISSTSHLRLLIKLNRHFP